MAKIKYEERSISDEKDKINDHFGILGRIFLAFFPDGEWSLGRFS